VRCLSCHYDLRKLAEHRCPECGHEFDPNDPRTFDVVRLRRRFRWSRITICTAFSLAAALISLALYFRHFDPFVSIIVGLFFWPILVLGTLVVHDFSLALWIGLRRHRQE
jgi:predicted amidophosphoribosyltransferase